MTTQILSESILSEPILNQSEATGTTDAWKAQGRWTTFPTSMPPLTASVEREVASEQENARLRLALREAHHRSGNQWQQLLGLAELERTQSPQTSAQGGSARLHTLISAFVLLNHTLNTDIEVLASSQSIRVRAALESFLTLLQATRPEDAALSFTVQDARLSEKGCAALLLSCAELVGNAAKHGGKTTQVTFRAQNAQGVLEVRDDGPGFPAEFCIEEQAGQGLQLVQALCRFDLNGEMRCHNEAQGGVVALTFPVVFVPEAAATALEATPATAESEGLCGMEGIVCFEPPSA